MKCYGRPAPGLSPEELTGTLIAIEGPDAVGRSTQIQLLSQWLEQRGYAVAQAGLSRSNLAAPELEAAKAGHQMRPTTMTLLYGADLMDQLENAIVPALRAGMVVLADRYVHTLMARARVRGLEQAWLDSVFEGTLVPHASYLMQATPRRLVERMLHKYGQLDYWEAGMDVGISPDWYTSFVRYQGRVRKALDELQDNYPFESVNANRAVWTIQRDLRARVAALLEDE